MKLFLEQNRGIINLILIIIFCSTLVFSNNLNSYCLFAIFFFNIYVFWDKNLLLLIVRNKYYLLFVSYFLLLTLNCFYSSDSQHSIKFLERNISFLFLPIGIGFMMRDNRVFKWVLNSMIWIMAVLLLYSLIIALSKNIIFNLANEIKLTNLKSWFFTYHYLAGNVNITAIYFSLYISFAGIILLYSMLIKDVLSNRWTFKFKFPLIIILSVGLLLLSARTILFTYIIITLFIMGIYFYREKRFLLFSIGISGLMAILGVFITSNDVLLLRFKGIFQPFEETKYFSGGLYSRIYQWKAVFKEYSQNNLLMGFGTGDSQHFYNQAYIQAKLPWAEIDSFNIHNMYLESLFSTGILGIIILLSILLISVFKGIKLKNTPYLLFLIIFMIAGLTESLLNRQYGIIFFLFVNFVFYYHMNHRLNEDSHIRN